MLSNKLNQLVFLFTILILLFSACNKVDSEKKDTILFNQVDSLISSPDSLYNGGIIISPPKDWTNIDSNLISLITAKLSQISDTSFHFEYNLLKIYFDSTSSSLLSVGTIIYDESIYSAETALSDYKSLFEKNLLTSNIKTGSYIKDNIEITQFLIQEKDNITFKLIFINNSNKIIQIDYILNPKIYLDIVKAVESSISSIKLIKQELL